MSELSAKEQNELIERLQAEIERLTDNQREIVGLLNQADKMLSRSLASGYALSRTWTFRLIHLLACLKRKNGHDSLRDIAAAEQALAHNEGETVRGCSENPMYVLMSSLKRAQEAFQNARLCMEKKPESRIEVLDDCENEESFLKIEKLQAETEKLKGYQNDAAAYLNQANRIIDKSLQSGYMLSKTREYKIYHLLGRLKKQGIQGGMKQKKAFVKWVLTRDGKHPDQDHTYNPIYGLIDTLSQVQEELQKARIYVRQKNEIYDEYVYENGKNWDFLNDEYNKYDVIVFSIIDYDSRYQRPQHIADHYAKKGHRVFYINASFQKEMGVVNRVQGNLHQIWLRSYRNATVYSANGEYDTENLSRQLEKLIIQYGIRDALMIADYPTWVGPIERLKKRFGFSLVTDYMDDFTGFVTTCEPFVKDNCIRLLELSDAVAASSQYLIDVVSEYNQNVTAVRNGTEFAHFYQAYQEQVPEKKRKTIGYYGAIAEWFDSGKIEYLANRFPQHDIVLIGHVSNEAVKGFQYKNVKILGEIPYAKLPEYLKDFDVCLIPFDTTTSLIKATNPVKFYEYLSAAKKIVATEIPELEPFKDQYVYLSNEDEQFGNYVELCLNGMDTLAQAQECLAFAKENDWACRIEAFEQVALSTFPKISIVVLCYNQLEYTRQCIQSILEHTAYPNYELIVVDNCSTDNTAEYLRGIEKTDPRIKIVLNSVNRGFAGGNNDGIAISDGEYIVLLNNDTLVTRGWLTGMAKHFAYKSDTGIVGAVTNSIGNEAQVEVTYHDIADMPVFAYEYTAAHMDETYDHDGVLAMFCVMFSRKLVSEIGLLDEHYGIGMFEDDDYSVAAKRAGYKLVLPEDVFIHHFGSVSFKKLENEAYRELFEKNKAYFKEKWNKEWEQHHVR